LIHLTANGWLRFQYFWNNCESGNSKVVVWGSFTDSSTFVLVKTSGESDSKHREICFWVSLVTPGKKYVESGSKISGNFRTSVESG
jgi:hypothetical protein